MSRICRFWALAFAALTIGCAARGRLDTPTGRPEILIQASREEVQGRILAYLHSRQYQVDQAGSSFIVGTKDLSTSDDPEDADFRTHSTVQSLFGRQGYGNLRSSFSLVGDPDGGTRIYLSECLFSINGFGAEQRRPIDGQRGLELSQAKLRAIADGR